MPYSSTEHHDVSFSGSTNWPQHSPGTAPNYFRMPMLELRQRVRDLHPSVTAAGPSSKELYEYILATDILDFRANAIKHQATRKPTPLR